MASRDTDQSLHQRDNTRTRLFDTTFRQSTAPSSPYARPERSDYSQSSLAQLESQSEQEVGLMGQKIQALKSLSIRMGDEIRGSNHTLDQLGDTFENTAAKLKGTFKNMMVMAQKSRISIKMWLLIFFIVALFFFWVRIR
ncbi:BET1 (YIL004C) [Zygosaccharomyces parabailii]|nr:BET1 (YIL004C) [Zygosaccharomyces parabailii]SJM86352.1 probable protein transport protein BET1 [Zygosaccharomyces bailii]